MSFFRGVRRLVGPLSPSLMSDAQPHTSSASHGMSSHRTFSGLSRSALRPWKLRASLRRAWGLLSDFKYEQTNPDIFYGHLAQDTVELIKALYQGCVAARPGGAGGAGGAARPGRASVTARPGRAGGAAQEAAHGSLAGKKILDVGGGPGYFGVAFDKEKAEYYTCEPDVGEMAAAGIQLASSVRGSGLDLPFRDEAFDITYSSNVAEHVPDPWRMLDEMLRVTAPGGVVIYSYTCWLGPFGGHETGLWPHYVGGEFAARRYRKRHGHEPKNRWGRSLFDVSCGDGLSAALAVNTRSPMPTGAAQPVNPGTQDSHSAGAALCSGAQLMAAFPRYHPWWAWWLVDVPILREFLVSNLVLVFRKP